MVNFYPVKASGFIRESLPEERELLIRSGIIPINDVFYQYFGQRNKVRLFYGGYGSGKSVFICQDLIIKCIHDPYFKCYYGRKVFQDVRGSCFETIVETIEDMGLSHLFRYSKADNSSMVILCLVNGNKFIPFGCDRADRLKSIKDPSHIWCEEFDQYEDGEEEKQGDFQLLFPRLRTTKAETEFIASFNTAPVYENHWILKYFFPELYKGQNQPEEWFTGLISGLSISKCFANYTDNHFIDQDDYYNRLKLASAGNSLLLKAIADGAWGVTENKKPWLYAFDFQKHVKPTLPFLPSFPIFAFFDFNNHPFACSIWQYSPNKGGKDAFIHCIKEFTGDFKLEEMCYRIKTTYPASILFVGGDRSGQNEEVGRNQTLYQIIAGLLEINDKQLHLNTTNLEHADSRFLVNALLSNYPNVYFSAEGCPNLIRQCQIAKEDEKSSKPSQLLKDRGLYKMDEFDSMRYFFQTEFLDFAKNAYFRAVKK